jgi:hypothetical protein
MPNGKGFGRKINKELSQHQQGLSKTTKTQVTKASVQPQINQPSTNCNSKAYIIYLMITLETLNLIPAMMGLFLHSSHETIYNSYQLQKTSNSSLQIRHSTEL